MALANVLGALILAAVFVIVARAVLGCAEGEVTIRRCDANCTSAGNLGIAFLTAIVGNPSQAAPIMLFQLGFMVPVSFAISTGSPGGGMTWKRTLLPAACQSAGDRRDCGTRGAVTGWGVPGILSQPIDMLAGAAVPVMLAMGVLAWRVCPTAQCRVIATLFRDLSQMYRRASGGLSLGAGLRLVPPRPYWSPTIAAAFPTANNVFVYAHRYNVGVPCAGRRSACPRY